MRVKHDLPRRVRELENTWIPLSDGTRLAARIRLPEDAERDPVPAILEYIPYRKNDWTARRDSVRHPYVATGMRRTRSCSTACLISGQLRRS